MKRKESLTPAIVWMNLEAMVLSEIARQLLCDSTYVRAPGQVRRGRGWNRDLQGLGRGNRELLFLASSPTRAPAVKALNTNC